MLQVRSGTDCFLQGSLWSELRRVFEHLLFLQILLFALCTSQTPRMACCNIFNSPEKFSFSFTILDNPTSCLSNHLKFSTSPDRSCLSHRSHLRGSTIAPWTVIGSLSVQDPLTPPPYFYTTCRKRELVSFDSAFLQYHNRDTKSYISCSNSVSWPIRRSVQQSESGSTRDKAEASGVASCSSTFLNTTFFKWDRTSGTEQVN